MAKLSDNMRGAFLMMASMAAFTFNDACIKALSDEMTLYQALVLRGVLTTSFLAVLTAMTGGFNIRVAGRDRWLLGIRTAAEIAAAYYFLTALYNMPLANVSAILQAMPLMVTLGGAIAFREPVGWRRWTAIVVGLCGVLLIVRPGAEGFNVYSVYAVLSVLCVTVRDLAVRRMGASVPSTLTAFAAAAGVTLFAVVGSFGVEWQVPSPAGWAQIVGAAGFVICGYLFVVMAMRVGEIAVVAPFRYTSLVVALILGLVVFGDWPDALTLTGAAIVVATGLFTFYRETQLGRARTVRPASR